MTGTDRRFYFLTLGCPRNEVDTDLLQTVLLDIGWTAARRPEDADLLVVNTCSFIVPAVEETVEAILEMVDVKSGSGAELVVTGCLVNRYGEHSLQGLLPEVDLFLPIGEDGKLVDWIGRRYGWSEAGAAPGSMRFSSTLDRGYVYIKISEGCARNCAFCTLPYIRGPLFSRPREEITEEARLFLDMGAKELILVAQDATSYGLDRYGRPSLPDLVGGLAGLEGDFMLRVMYLHPAGVDAGLIEAMTSPKVCSYFDLPLQHVDAGLLKAMGRGGGEGEFRKLLGEIRERMGKASLRSTFIIGFPGEDRAAFDGLRRFLMEMRFDWLGLFGYSHEEGTPAFSLDKAEIPRQVIEERMGELRELQEEIMREKALDMIGRKFRVLVEGESDEAPGYWEARSWMQAPEIDGVIFLEADEGLEGGSLRDVVITDCEGIDLIGRLERNGEEESEGKGEKLESSQRPDLPSHRPGSGYSPFASRERST